MVVIFATIFFIPFRSYSQEYLKNQKGVWVVRHNLTSKSKIDKLITHLQEIRAENVYLQVRGRGYAYYQSEIEPKSPDIQGDFDPLAYFLSKTDSLQFSVHAWVNSYLLWTSPENPSDNSHLFYQKKDWFEVTLKPGNNRRVRNIYLSPHLSEVRQYLVALVAELCEKYSIDGVHLDYIRYDSKYYGYHPQGLAEFYTLCTPPENNSSWLLINDQRWIQYRASKIDLLIDMIDDLRKVKYPYLQLSAAVKPNPGKAAEQFGQNWVKWLNDGQLDHVVIMNYTINNDDFFNNLSAIKNQVNINNVYVGIGLWNKNSYRVQQQLKICDESGFKHRVLFSYDTIIEKYF